MSSLITAQIPLVPAGDVRTFPPPPFSCAAARTPFWVPIHAHGLHHPRGSVRTPKVSFWGLSQRPPRWAPS